LTQLVLRTRFRCVRARAVGERAFGARACGRRTCVWCARAGALEKFARRGPRGNLVRRGDASRVRRRLASAAPPPPNILAAAPGRKWLRATRAIGRVRGPRRRRCRRHRRRRHPYVRFGGRFHWRRHRRPRLWHRHRRPRRCPHSQRCRRHPESLGVRADTYPATLPPPPPSPPKLSPHLASTRQRPLSAIAGLVRPQFPHVPRPFGRRRRRRRLLRLCRASPVPACAAQMSTAIAKTSVAASVATRTGVRRRRRRRPRARVDAPLRLGVFGCHPSASPYECGSRVRTGSVPARAS